MSQRKGLYFLLDIPFVYRFAQWLFYHEESYSVWYNLVGNFKNKIVLDIGCGPGTETEYFKGSQKYIGVDISQKYIDEAKSNYSHLGEFHCCSIDEIGKLPLESIDIVTLKGVFHHLPDELVIKFLEQIHSKLSDSGKILTLDGTFIKGKYISNFIVGLDRGKHVRTIDGFKSLVPSNFNISRDELVYQGFPPYQRYYMEITKK